jgi:hypothetical protein
MRLDEPAMGLSFEPLTGGAENAAQSATAFSPSAAGKGGDRQSVAALSTDYGQAIMGG